MKMLLTNDDGIEAPGLIALHQCLKTLGDVIVVAPSGCRSGTSHSITYIEPLRIEEYSVKGHFTGVAVHGSPADCVKIASHKLLEAPVDLVVSGINDGANVGINMYYSGTVAAAMEAALMGLPAIAFSVSSSVDVDFDQTAEYCLQVLQDLLPLHPKDLLNVNIPHQNYRPPKGLRVVPQAIEGFNEYYTNSAPQDAYQLTAGTFFGNGLPTDAAILEQGYITVTPLHVDMTNHAGMTPLEQRLCTKTPDQEPRN